VGAGADPYNDKDLQLVYEMHGSGFKALPTYAVIPAVNQILTMAKEGHQAPGLNFGLDRLLHGEQYTEIKRPLPSNTKLTHESKVKDIWDKGKHAVVVYETISRDESGEELMRNELTAVIRGAGGWGGDRGPTDPGNEPPDRKPDATVTEKIDDSQALLYRLSGDWNPLHVDPTFAKAFGFEKPILHGLCTFGFVGRHVTNSFSDGDPRFFKSIKVRFADSVFPGETLITEMWKESGNRVVFRCKVKERDAVVISNAAIELYDEIPKPAAKPKAKAKGQGAAVSAEPISRDVFVAMGQFVAGNADVGKIDKVYQFRLSAPESVWTLDLKKGEVSEGETAKSECTLELSDADFMDMCTGKADPQKLYFGGKLKISGDVMASQKLTFLSKIDPNLVLEAAKARAGSGGGGGGEVEAAADVDEPGSWDVFIAIRDHIERNPDLIKVGKVFQFRLTDPESVWTVDVKNDKGAVGEGETIKPDCTLELTDTDFMGMTRGELDPQQLYFGGKLKISGDVMASQKLTFLQKIDPNQAVEAVKKARAERSAGTAPKAAAPAPKAEPVATSVFEKLKERLGAKPGLADEVSALMQFVVTGPDSAWIVDMRKSPGSVETGQNGEAAVTFTISDGDLKSLVSGEASAHDMYMRGSLRVDGDVRVAQRLAFLKGLL